MGAFSKTEDVTISNKPGWEPHEWVVIRGTLTFSIRERLSKMSVARGSNKVDLDIDRANLLDAMIKSWYLTGDGNETVPLCRENIDALPTHYADAILEEIDKVSAKGNPLAPEQAQAFMNGASERTSTN